jgi:SAM-dependent methyltransferase
VVFLVLFVACLALSALAFWSWFFLAFLIPAALFGYILLIVGLSKWRLSPGGGDYQDKVHQLIVRRARGASMLDVGCGSGHLLAELAKAHPSAALVGLDYWGENWEYSQELCEANFRAEGLEGRATFIRGTASALPLDPGEFETVVSCMTFHEVRDVDDKTVSLRQAVGRLAPGGRFVFVDLFDDPKFYPEPGRIQGAIAEAGGVISDSTHLGELMPLPFPLRHKRVLGHARLVAGERKA